MKKFPEYVCLVTGASRGIGKGIALGLANLGATIYITGRTLEPSGKGVGGSLQETASEIVARGGTAIPVAVDHADEQQVQKLFDRIKQEQHGRLDVLVNNAYAAVRFLVQQNGKAYYEIDQYSPGEAWDIVNNVGLRNHYICSTLATRMMAECRKQVDGPTNPGLIVNISSVGGKRYLFNVLYGVGKAAVDRMARDMSIELKKNKLNISIISLWPGAVRTEELMSASSTAPEGRKPPVDFTDPDTTESPEMSGLAVSALVAEPSEKLLKRSGDIVFVCDVAREYNLRESDGRAPPDYRAVHMLLKLGGFNTLCRFVPAFVRIPRSMFMGMLSYYK